MNTNTQSAESTIKDTNYAAAMSNFTQAQVASQAGVAMLSQANQLPQEILSLIKGG
jgi:flagellin